MSEYEFYQQLQEATAPQRAALLDQPVVKEALAGVVTLSRYRAFLQQAFHHVRHTVPLMMACGGRLEPRLQWLREALAQYINEELGHERWILDDLAACDGDPQAVSRSRPAPETELFVAYAYYLIDRGNPVGLLGMIQVLEDTSVRIAHAAADQVQQQLSLPDSAFRYLHTHGSLDQAHVAFFRQLVNRLEAGGDRQAVINAAQQFYRLYAAMLAALPALAGEV